MKIITLIVLLALSSQTNAQEYWQQAVDYKMDVEMDVETFKYSGKQELLYTNNSPDSIKKVFYHLYYNAFQPGSEMAVRIKTGKDINTRFKIDIDSIKKSEIGYLRVFNLKQEENALKYEECGTIMAVSYTHQTLPTIYSV